MTYRIIGALNKWRLSCTIEQEEGQVDIVTGNANVYEFFIPIDEIQEWIGNIAVNEITTTTYFKVVGKTTGGHGVGIPVQTSLDGYLFTIPSEVLTIPGYLYITLKVEAGAQIFITKEMDAPLRIEESGEATIPSNNSVVNDLLINLVGALTDGEEGQYLTKTSDKPLDMEWASAVIGSVESAKITAQSNDKNILVGTIGDESSIQASNATISPTGMISAPTFKGNLVGSVTGDVNLANNLAVTLTGAVEGQGAINSLSGNNLTIETSYSSDFTGRLIFGGTVSASSTMVVSTSDKWRAATGLDDTTIELTTSGSAEGSPSTNSGIYFIIAEIENYADPLNIGPISIGDQIISDGTNWVKIAYASIKVNAAEKADYLDDTISIGNQSVTPTQKGELQFTLSDIGASASDHTHGSITSTGRIGSISGQYLITGDNGTITTTTPSNSVFIPKNGGAVTTSGNLNSPVLRNIIISATEPSTSSIPEGTIWFEIEEG